MFVDYARSEPTCKLFNSNAGLLQDSTQRPCCKFPVQWNDATSNPIAGIPF
jgi:hypothetical protein